MMCRWLMTSRWFTCLHYVISFSSDDVSSDDYREQISMRLFAADVYFERRLMPKMMKIFRLFLIISSPHVNIISSRGIIDFTQLSLFLFIFSMMWLSSCAGIDYCAKIFSLIVASRFDVPYWWWNIFWLMSLFSFDIIVKTLLFLEICTLSFHWHFLVSADIITTLLRHITLSLFHVEFAMWGWLRHGVFFHFISLFSMMMYRFSMPMTFSMCRKDFFSFFDFSADDADVYFLPDTDISFSFHFVVDYRREYFRRRWWCRRDDWCSHWLMPGNVDFKHFPRLSWGWNIDCAPAEIYAAPPLRDESSFDEGKHFHFRSRRFLVRPPSMWADDAIDTSLWCTT